MTLPQAIRGPWATHWMLWLALFPPGTLIVLLRESTTEYPAWWWPLLSATAQHLLAGVVVIGGGAIARRRVALIPIWVFAVLWGLAGVAHGVIGALVAEHVAGVEGDMLFRVAAWSVMTVAWIPAIVYAIALVDQRRTLLGELAAAQGALEGARSSVVESSEAVQERLARTVRQSVAPILDDLQHSLAAARDDLDGVAFTAISERLSRLLDETSRLVESPQTPPDAPVTAPRRASLREAFDVRVDRPWTVAGLVGFATLAVLLPDTARVFGALAALELVVATAAAALVLGAVIAAAGRIPAFAAGSGVAVALGGAGTAMLVSTWLMLTSGIDPVTWHGAAVLPLLLGGMSAACTVMVAAVVLARANDADARILHDRLAELQRLLDAQERALDRERHHLGELMHGPVQGRIAACVMALKFFSSSDAEPGALASITEQVLEHLAAAARDLAVLAGAPDRQVPPN